MTVAELIEKLKAMPPEAEVMVWGFQDRPLVQAREVDLTDKGEVAISEC